MTDYKTVKASELEEGMVILDVRTVNEHQAQHLLMRSLQE